VLLPEASRVIAWGVPALLLVGGTLSLERTSNIQRFRFFQLVGDASYSIYLSHILTIEVVELFAIKVGLHTTTLSEQGAFVALCILTSLIVGIVVYYVIERPLLTQVRRMWQPSRSVAGG
jgi:exopolysaccharide production protein ExoZ